MCALPAQICPSGAFAWAKGKLTDRLNRLVLLHAPRLGMGIALPLLPRRHRLHRRHICARRVAHRQIIGVEANDDRCEHRIRGAELAEEKLPCPAETRAGVDESLIDALYIGERLVAHFDRTARAADIHWAFA